MIWYPPSDSNWDSRRFKRRRFAKLAYRGIVVWYPPSDSNRESPAFEDGRFARLAYVGIDGWGFRLSRIVLDYVKWCSTFGTEFCFRFILLSTCSTFWFGFNCNSLRYNLIVFCLSKQLKNDDMCFRFNWERRHCTELLIRFGTWNCNANIA